MLEEKDYIPSCAGDFVIKRNRHGIAPFKFLTAFLHHSPRRISEGQWVEKTVWKNERAWFLDQTTWKRIKKK